MNRFQMNDPLETLHSIISTEAIITMQKRAREVLVGNDVQDYLLEIIEATRNHELIEIGVSPGNVGIYESDSSTGNIK